uniref:Uncharacterized protein n=1 Tax=Zea mays TaxID=4577 RepID=A0A804R719_MAIZE
MAASSADPAQHHASSRPPLLLAVRHLPFPGVPRTRTFPVPGPDVLAPLARRLEELASAAAAHPLLKPLFAAHSHLSSFSQEASGGGAACHGAVVRGALLRGGARGLGGRDGGGQRHQ